MNRIKVQYVDDASLVADAGQHRWIDPATGQLYLNKEDLFGVRTMQRTQKIGEWCCTANPARRAHEVDGLVELAGPEELVALPDAHGGLKYDGGKPRWSLLMRGCANALQAAVRVLTFGAQKYADDSWQGVQNGQQRYRDALYRHMNAIERGELVDDESGESHWAHVATNALFLYELHKDQK